VSLLSLLRPGATAAPPCVAVVVPDGPDAVPAGHRGQRAPPRTSTCRCCCSCPCRAPAPPVSAPARQRGRCRCWARSLPLLALTHVELSHRVVPHPARGGSRRQVALGGAVCEAAVRHGAVLLVAPEGLPVPPPCPRVLRVPATAPAWSRA
jgi:hypothetical protein